MIQYDLTNTPLTTSDLPIRPPSDAELFAITVALLSFENRSFGDLVGSSVGLTARNRRRVAELIEQRTPSLSRDFGGRLVLRRRLDELTGLVISRGS